MGAFDFDQPAPREPVILSTERHPVPPARIDATPVYLAYSAAVLGVGLILARAMRGRPWVRLRGRWSQTSRAPETGMRSR